MKKNTFGIFEWLTALFILFNHSAHANLIEYPSPTDTTKIIRKFIRYDEERKQLSVEYLQKRHGIKAAVPIIHPRMIVLHYTDGGSIAGMFQYFNKTRIEDSRTLNKKQSDLNVSAHYLIDRDGTIYQLIPDTLFARHVIGLNYCSIGIENIGSDKNPLTDAQWKANVELIIHLKKRYPIEYIIGHSEYAAFKKTTWWKETNPDYFTHKKDPGAAFMKKIRSSLLGFDFKPLP